MQVLWVEPPRPAGETRNVKEADVWITSLTRNILIIFFRLHKRKRAHRGRHKQGDTMLIRFFLDFSDPCFLWIFCWKPQFWCFCSKIFPLSFLSAATCAYHVVCSPTRMSITNILSKQYRGERSSVGPHHISHLTWAWESNKCRP